MAHATHLPFKAKIALPFFLLFALVVIPTRWVILKITGKSTKIKTRILSNDELALLEAAGRIATPIVVNGRTVVLKPFTLDAHAHAPTCGCPLELSVDDTTGKPCLFLSRTHDGVVTVHTWRPFAWGLLGYIGSDLHALTLPSKACSM